MTKDYKPAKSPLGLWRALQIGLFGFMFFDVALVLSDVETLVFGNRDPETDAVSALLALWSFLIALGYIAFLLWCIVMTLRVTYRTMRNLHALEAPLELKTPAWSVGWYFVPFANLVMPYRVAKEIWNGTFLLAGDEGKASPALLPWWLAWIVANILDNISLRVSDSEPQLAVALAVVAAVLSVIGSVLMMNVFGPIARAQHALIEGGAQKSA